MSALRAFIREGLNVGFAMGAGDMIAQLAIEKKGLEGWDYWRTVRYSALGVLLVGPVLRKWYGTLDTLVQPKQSLFQRGIKKMIIDQACFAPPFTLILSFIVPCMHGEKPNMVVERIKQSYFSIMATNYLLWCPAQILNFSLVPLKFQVIYAQCVAIIWNCYLSHKLN